MRSDSHRKIAPRARRPHSYGKIDPRARCLLSYGKIAPRAGRPDSYGKIAPRAVRPDSYASLVRSPASYGEIAPLALRRVSSAPLVTSPASYGEIVPLAMLLDSYDDPFAKFRDTEKIAASAMSSTVGAMSSTKVPDSEEIAPHAMSSTVVPDSEEIASSTMSSTVVSDSEEIAHPRVSSAVVSDSEGIAHPRMSSTVAPDSEESDSAEVLDKYDVFINHRGIDVKDSFVSTIYHTFDIIGVRAFVDREELNGGGEISYAIKEAISNALVHIAIFSPNYAHSPRCLDELTLMLQTGKKIIPIFYHVEPSHLRWVKGVYSEAFSKHENDSRYTPQKLEEWKEALSTVSNISGLELNERQKDQGFLLREIVNIVNNAMSSTVVPDFEEIAPPTMSSTMTPDSREIASSSEVPHTYDVFINHTRIDVKDSLANTIYHTLKLIGVRTFLDREELQVGVDISYAIKEAIYSAFVHIAIFSPNYGQSRWCLDELTLMLQTGKRIIPIFYHVEPSHLRWVAHGRGIYSQTFSKYEKDGRYTPQKLEEWKKALSTVSHISGLVLNERHNDEELLLKQIVNTVMAEMRMPLLHVATHPVGLDEAIGNFQNFVETQCAQSRQNVKIVGIVGVGGCGKTTLVKEYFDKRRSSYSRSSFLRDVRDAAANNRLQYLKEKLLQDLAHSEGAIHHKSEGKRILKHPVQSEGALIVLDDVDHIDQIEALLLPLKGNLQPDSLIIVTTRDSNVIASSASLSPSVSPIVYKIRELDSVHAKQLLCWHAFLRDSPVKGFEDLVEEFVNACQGLPLSLKVLGMQLYGKNKYYWKSTLHKISTILPDDIKQRLKVAYDVLDEEQKQMFLDIACFFIGEQKDMAISIWDGSSSDGFLWNGWHGFNILESNCLVEVDHENCIRMHNHLRDLGREIAIKETPSRFWSHSQFVDRQRLKERLPMRGIMAATGSSYGNCKLHYEPPFEECMKLLTGHSTSRSRRLTPSAFGLQLLVVRGDYFKKQFAKLSEELVWLRWYDFPHKKLPSWLSTGKLRVLELYQSKRLAKLWKPNDAPPSLLRELIIYMSESDSCNLQMIPETIGVLKHLKKIVLKGGAGQNKVSSLPDEFCLLESLEHLELPGFLYLSSLPTGFGNLRKLKHIDLSGCQTLTALPVSFNKLTELQYLDLTGCWNLQLETDILENITKLEKLRLDGCSKLQMLPSEITRQKYLRELCLSSTGLRLLPADIDRLTELEVLEIGGPCFASLPGNLSSLIKLKIKDCSELKYLPSLENLSCLIELSIHNCRGLKHLPHVGCLTRLEHLELWNLDVKYLPEGFGQLVNLQNLEILHCPIRELPLANREEHYLRYFRLKRISLCGTAVSTIAISEDCCPSIEHLVLLGNPDLMEIETLPTKLQWLRIERCPQLHKLPTFAGLVELRHFLVEECPQLDELPSLACCTCLEELKIKGSSRVTKIEGLEQLRLLKTLRLGRFRRFEEAGQIDCTAN